MTINIVDTYRLVAALHEADDAAQCADDPRLAKIREVLTGLIAIADELDSEAKATSLAAFFDKAESDELMLEVKRRVAMQNLVANGIKPHPTNRVYSPDEVIQGAITAEGRLILK